MKQKKRRVMLPWEKRNELQDRIVARLLSPRSHPRLTNEQMLKLLRKGKPLPADKWRDMENEIHNCFSPYIVYWMGLEPPNPKGVCELSPEPPNLKGDRREGAATINRIKDFLCKNGLKPGEADQLIAKALGVSSAGTLRQKLQRAKKLPRTIGG
jgi:hypothetical protein